MFLLHYTVTSVPCFHSSITHSFPCTVAVELMALGPKGALGDCYQPLDEGLPLVGVLGVLNVRDGTRTCCTEALKQLQQDVALAQQQEEERKAAEAKLKAFVMKAGQKQESERAAGAHMASSSGNVDDSSVRSSTAAGQQGGGAQSCASIEKSTILRGLLEGLRRGHAAGVSGPVDNVMESSDRSASEGADYSQGSNGGVLLPSHHSASTKSLQEMLKQMQGLAGKGVSASGEQTGSGDTQGGGGVQSAGGSDEQAGQSAAERDDEFEVWMQLVSGDSQACDGFVGACFECLCLLSSVFLGFMG